MGNEIKFNHYRADSERDLLHFIEDNDGKDIYEKIGENPKKWIDELSWIYEMFAKTNLVCTSGIDSPPTSEKEFKKLGDKVYLYRGENKRLRGLWIYKCGNDSSKATNWEHYRLGDKANLTINKEFPINYTNLIPENFEKIAKIVEKEKDKGYLADNPKRPIMKFNADGFNIYAKGSQILCAHYYEEAKPWFRLTSFSNINKETAESEMNKTIEMSNLGIKTPRVIGYYESLFEDFFFAEEVQGKSPKEYIQSHRDEIIMQDSEMLANLCSSGYCKFGFTDFDDKIFDGKNLYLIDVDECSDIYAHDEIDYRSVLINPKSDEKFKLFRKYQIDRFKQELKDAIYEYRNDLLQNSEDKKNYVKTFYKSMRWKEPDKNEIKKLITFPDNYITRESNISMMMDTE